MKKIIDIQQFLLQYIFPFGLIMQMTGVLWLNKGSIWHAQIYIWCLLPAFIYLLLNGTKILNWRPSQLEIWTIMFFIWVFCSKAWSDTSMSWLVVFKRLFCIALYIYFLSRLVINSDRLIKILIFCGILAGIFAGLSLINHYTEIVNSFITGCRDFRIQSFIVGGFADLGNCIMAGLYYAIFASLLFSWFVNANFSSFKFICVLLLLLILSLYVLATWSRGACLSLAFGIFISFIFKIEKKGLIFIVSLLLICSFFYKFNQWFIGSTMTDNVGGRLSIWQTAWHEIINNPWIGSGFASSFEALNNFGDLCPHPHNYYLQILREFGIIGMGLFFAVLINMLKILFIYRQQLLIKMIIATMAVSLIGLMSDVENIFVRPGDTWLYLWFPLGIILGVDYKNRLSTK